MRLRMASRRTRVSRRLARAGRRLPASFETQAQAGLLLRMRGLVQAQIRRVALAESSAAQAERFMSQRAATTLILRSHAASHGVSKDEGFQKAGARRAAASCVLRDAGPRGLLLRMRGLVQAQILRVALAESSAAQAERFMSQPAATTLILRSHAASHGG